MLNNNVLNDLVMSTRKSCKFGGEKALLHVASLMNQYSFIIPDCDHFCIPIRHIL